MKHTVYLQVSVFQVAQPEGLLTVVEGERGLDSVHKLLQAFLQSRHMIGQRRGLTNLR